MRNLISIGCLFGFLVFSSVSLADGYIRIAGVYLSDASGQGTTTNTTRTLLEAGAGWISQGGWTVGALYATEKVKSGSSASADRTSMGPTFGWITRKEEGFYALGTYHISTTFTPDYKGTGYQLDGGYKFKIRKLGLALQMSYKHFDYNKAGSATLSPSYTVTKIDPYAVLFFEF